MTIRKCDMCKTEVSGKMLSVGLSPFHGYVELCKSCAEPYIKLLDEQNLLQEKLMEAGFKTAQKEVS